MLVVYFSKYYQLKPLIDYLNVPVHNFYSGVPILQNSAEFIRSFKRDDFLILCKDWKMNIIINVLEQFQNKMQVKIYTVYTEVNVAMRK